MRVELHDAVRHLNRVGGSDILIVDGRVYEIASRELDADTVRQAVRNLIEEKGDERTAE